MSKHRKKPEGGVAGTGAAGRVAATAEGAPRWLAPLALALVFAMTAAARLPFLDNPLVGEETYFAYLAAANGRDGPPPDHQFLYQARIGGRMRFNAAEHPVPPYLFITKVLRPLGGAGTDFASWSFERKSRAGRLPFFITFCAALAGLLILAGIHLRGAPVWTVLLCAGVLGFGLTAPLVVGGSIQPQVDGSIGVLWVVLAALALAGASRRLPGAAAGVLGALAGFAACLGKNEWALAMGGAAAAGLALAWAAGRVMRNAECGMRNEANSPPTTHNSQLTTRPWPLAPGPWPLVLGIFAGLAAGSLFSYMLDPYNYTHGLDVMARTQRATAARWAETFGGRLPWIWPVLTLAAAGMVAGAARWRQLFTDYLGRGVLLLWGLGLLAGFLASSWPGDFFPRYFCTAAFGLLCFLAVWLPRLRLGAPVAAAGLLLLLAGTGVHLEGLWRIHAQGTALGSSPGKSLAAHRRMIELTAGQAAAAGRPPTTDLNFGYYHPELDFIANVVSAERVDEYMRE